MPPRKADAMSARVSPPPGSRIYVVEATAEHLIIHIPGGGEHCALPGWFALIGGAFACIFSHPAVIEAFQHAPRARPLWSHVVELGVLWSASMAMAVYWSRLRFERMTLLIERHRVAVQR